MPSIHISEAVFKELVEQEGGYQEAKQRVKELAREDVSNTE